MSTIVALSTPVGRGALAVVRLSGPQSLEIACRLAPELHNVNAREARLAQLRYPTGEVLDEAIITFFQAPASVTGEDVIEISCHGSPGIVRQVLDFALENGARLAGPGEFTQRALLNGKLNLTEAEAIRDLIAAQTQAAVKQAARQVGGELSKRLEHYKERLISAIVVLESAVEFVEEDLPPTQIDSIEQSLRFVHRGLDELRASFSAGQLLQHGARIAIAGSPNVGKSSLFNRLVELDRAIVTDIPGTTRDTLEQSVDIGGIPVVLTDTAGLRETEDSIESLGIERTRRAISDADLVLEVFDASNRYIPQAHAIEVPSITVLNKVDLVANREPREGVVWVSALTGEGLKELRAAILNVFNGSGLSGDGLLITNARQHELLKSAVMEMESALSSLEERRSEEMILAPLHNCLRLVGGISGETTTEDILGEIFSTFCIGK